MRGNEARMLIPQDQIDENTVEARIARIESDIAHIKSDVSNVQLDVRELRNETKVANKAIADVAAAVVAVESKIIKWIIGTVIAAAGLAFSIARFIH